MKKIEELDGIRGIAICFVILFHCLRFPNTSVFTDFANRILASLWVGVDLFFVLSGFLITSILLMSQEDPHRIRNFYARRTLRIFPLYFFVLGVLAILGLMKFSPASSCLSDLPYAATYTLNLRIALAGWPESELIHHFWSLCIEEQFYLAWPFLVFFTPRRWLEPILLVAIFGSAITRIVGVQLGAGWEFPFAFPLGRVDGLSIGALLAVAQARLKSDPENTDSSSLPHIMMSPPVMGLCIVLTLLAFWIRGGLSVQDAELLTLLPTVIAIAYLPLFFAALSPQEGAVKRLLRNRVLQLAGKYSYGLYVYHQIVRVFVREHLGIAESPAGFLVIVCISIVVSLLSFHLLELPCLKLKSRFAGHHSPESDKLDSEVSSKT